MFERLPIESHSGTSVFEAVEWVQQLFLGQIATALAVIAIALIGVQLLTGRLVWRDGARVVLGCFILFGAPAIARGFMAAARDAGGVSYLAPVRSAPALTIVPKQSPQFDPYAGASVHM